MHLDELSAELDATRELVDLVARQELDPEELSADEVERVDSWAEYLWEDAADKLTTMRIELEALPLILIDPDSKKTHARNLTRGGVRLMEFLQALNAIEHEKRRRKISQLFRKFLDNATDQNTGEKAPPTD